MICDRYGREKHTASQTQSTVVTIYLSRSALCGVDKPIARIAEKVI